MSTGAVVARDHIPCTGVTPPLLAEPEKTPSPVVSSLGSKRPCHKISHHLLSAPDCNSVRARRNDAGLPHRAADQAVRGPTPRADPPLPTGVIPSGPSQWLPGPCPVPRSPWWGRCQKLHCQPRGGSATIRPETCSSCCPTQPCRSHPCQSDCLRSRVIISTDADAIPPPHGMVLTLLK